MRAKNAINIYNEQLEQHITGNKILCKDGVSVICSDDSELKLSYLYRSVWVKRLSLEKLIQTVKKYKIIFRQHQCFVTMKKKGKNM